MPFSKQESGPTLAFRLPWAGRCPRLDWPPGKVAGFLAYELPVFREAHRIGNVLQAVDTMARIEEVLCGSAKSGVYCAHIDAAAKNAGIDLDLDGYRSLRDAYIHALVTGEIGEWDPNEQAYPRYSALRDVFYRRPPIRPNLHPKVQVPGYANEKRLVVGNVMAGRKPQNQILYRPAPNTPPAQRPREVRAAPQEMWWSRKTVGGHIPKLRKGTGLEY